MIDKPMSVNEQLRLAEKNLEYLLEWVGRFDNKSSVILGIDTGMLGVLATFAPAKNLWDSLMIAFAILSTLFLSISLLFIYLGNYPRLKGPSNSLFFFGSICSKDFKKYQQEFTKRSYEEQLKDILEQCHRNSEILNQKFCYLKWAYRMLFVGVILWAITIYLFRSAPSI